MHNLHFKFYKIQFIIYRPFVVTKSKYVKTGTGKSDMNYLPSCKSWSSNNINLTCVKTLKLDYLPLQTVGDIYQHQICGTIHL